MLSELELSKKALDLQRELWLLEEGYNSEKKKTFQLQQQVSWLEEENSALLSQLARAIFDLRSLQSTRVVRVSRLVGNPKTLLSRLLVSFYRSAPGEIRISPAPNPSSQIVFPVEVSTSKQNEPPDYQEWITTNEPGQEELEVQKINSGKMSYQPLFSLILLVSKDSDPALKVTLDSILGQTYPYWELLQVKSIPPSSSPIINSQDLLSQDQVSKPPDSQEKVKRAESLSSAIEQAKGEFLACLKPGEELTPFALFEAALYLSQHPGAGFIYSDEDWRDHTGYRNNPFFKPDWSPDLFYSIPYTGQLALYRTSLLRGSGDRRKVSQEAYYYDLALEVVEKTEAIYHIPKILCHSSQKDCPAANWEKGWPGRRKILEDNLLRQGFEKLRVEPGLLPGSSRIRYPISGQPRVSIIIPTRDLAGHLKQCLLSIRVLSTYPNYEIIIIDNNSVEKETLELFNSLQDDPVVRILKYPGEFNFSAINNFAVSQLDSELLLFLNNDTQVISPGWLEAMAEQALRPEVGAVGARLLYPNDQIQHAGVVMGLGVISGHAHWFTPAQSPGYF